MCPMYRSSVPWKVGQHFRNALGCRYKSSSTKSKRRVKEESIPRLINTFHNIIFSCKLVMEITERLAMDIISNWGIFRWCFLWKGVCRQYDLTSSLIKTSEEDRTKQYNTIPFSNDKQANWIEGKEKEKQAATTHTNPPIERATIDGTRRNRPNPLYGTVRYGAVYARDHSFIYFIPQKGRS